jgi:hypothetical protein
VREVDQINLPDNLQTLLIARIDQLEEETRHTLQLASVIGRSFYFRVLEAINQVTPLEQDGLERQLNSLERAELILKAGYIPELEYTFRHSITQEAAYNTILVKQRREFHRRVGETIERLFAPRLEDWYVVLAFHFGEAQDDRLAHYAILAGDAAFRLNAIKEAVDLYSQALSVLSTLQSGSSPGAQEQAQLAEQLKYLYLRLGRCRELQSDYPAALRYYEEMEGLADRTQDRTMQLEALVAQATAFAIPTPMQNPEKSKLLASQALGMALEDGNKAIESRINWVFEVMNTYSGRTREAIPYGERSAALARELDLHEQLAYALQDMVYPLYSVGRIDEAFAALTESQKLWEELSNLPMLIENYTGLIYGLILSGRFDEAEAVRDKAFALSEKIGNNWSKVNCQFFIAVVYHARGEISRAIEHIRHSIPLALEVGHPGIGFLWVQLVWIYQSLGNLPQAFVAADQALDATSTFPPFKAMGQIAKAMLHLDNGELEKAREYLDHFDTSEFYRVLIDIYFFYQFARIELDRLSGNLTSAMERILKQLAEVRRFGLDYFLAPSLRDYARLQMELEHLPEAEAVLSEAADAARKIGDRMLLWLILAEQAQVARLLGKADAAIVFESEATAEAGYLLSQIKEEELRSSFLQQTRNYGLNLEMQLQEE